VVGPNWFITGEAASMVDPITANGVTAALRHAAEASALILKYRHRGTVSLSARFAYSFRILQMAQFFNNGIEQVVYQPPVRNRFGIRNSGTAYISPAWSMNLIYARVSPKGILSTLLFSLFLGFFRASEWIVYQLCKRFSPAARTAS
jgi:menaquinone-9 beta-reductase